MTATDDLVVRRGEAPLLLSMPHVGTDIPDDIAAGLVSPWLARKDADWWIEALYGFAAAFDATIVRARVSRTVIDVNRDPAGVSLYPGQATTGLCPLETFDGEPLYQPGRAPDAAEIDRRRRQHFAPYHAALTAEIGRLRAAHPAIVLYDCHAIRSEIPRLFDGQLPVFNLGTNGGAAAAPALRAALIDALAASGQTYVADGRFKGGYITRHYGRPAEGVEAVQMEIAMRGYLDEPEGAVSPANWPVAFEAERAAATAAVLRRLIERCLDHAHRRAMG